MSNVIAAWRALAEAYCEHREQINADFGFDTNSIQLQIAQAEQESLRSENIRLRALIGGKRLFQKPLRHTHTTLSLTQQKPFLIDYVFFADIEKMSFCLVTFQISNKRTFKFYVHFRVRSFMVVFRIRRCYGYDCGDK